MKFPKWPYYSMIYWRLTGLAGESFYLYDMQMSTYVVDA
jgi:hypothetical protein